ncbi:MAG: hypothetical protein ACI81S_001384 [Sphingobacteriales bacterium]|jgi:hypothetical protein
MIKMEAQTPAIDKQLGLVSESVKHQLDSLDSIMHR